MVWHVGTVTARLTCLLVDSMLSSAELLVDIVCGNTIYAHMRARGCRCRRVAEINDATRGGMDMRQLLGCMNRLH